MQYIDTSVIYHVVRVQSVIKLYVIYNMLDVSTVLWVGVRGIEPSAGISPRSGNSYKQLSFSARLSATEGGGRRRRVQFS